MPPRRPKRPRTSEHSDRDADASAAADADADATAITDSEHWTEGDCELISSDNVRFRVPTYHLQSRSVVFRDMIGDGGTNEKRVHFTDVIETSTVLDDFLALIAESDLVTDSNELFVDDEGFDRSANLLKFLIKYNCPLARRTFLQNVWGESLLGRASPRFAFTLGAMAAPSDYDPAVHCCHDNWGMTVCDEAIDHVNRYRRREISESASLGSDEYTLEPAQFGVRAWSLIPPAFQWGLCKLYTAGVFGKDGNFSDFVEEAEEHEREQAREAVKYT